MRCDCLKQDCTDCFPAARQANQPQPITDFNPDIREIAFDFVGDLGLPEHRSKEWLGERTERLIKRIVAVVNKYRQPQGKAQPRICQYCDSDKWSARYLSNQCPDTYPEGMWMHKKGNLTMPCNLQQPQEPISPYNVGAYKERLVDGNLVEKPPQVKAQPESGEWDELVEQAEKAAFQRGQQAMAEKRVSAEMVANAVGKFGADIPWCESVARRIMA